MEEVKILDLIVVVLEVAWKVVMEVVRPWSMVLVELKLLVEEAVTGMVVVRKHYKVLLESVEIMVVLVVIMVELAAVAGMVVEVEPTMAEGAAEVAILTPAQGEWFHLLLWFTRKEFN